MATSIKKRLFISPTPPADNDLSGYHALPFVQVRGTVSLGALGFSHATVEQPELETGLTRTFKGARTGTAAQITFAQISNDPGQIALAAADDGSAETALMIVDPSGLTATYWTGIVHSLTSSDSDVSSYEGAQCSFVPNYPPVFGPPPGGGETISVLAGTTIINPNTIIQGAP